MPNDLTNARAVEIAGPVSSGQTPIPVAISGGGGGGVDTTITAPLGSQPAVDSVSTAQASDQFNAPQSLADHTVVQGTSPGLPYDASLLYAMAPFKVGGVGPFVPAAVALTSNSGGAITSNPLDVHIAGTTGDVGVNLDQVGGVAVTLGQTTMAASIPVTLASNQTDIGVNLDKVGGSVVALGQTTMAASIPVVPASNYVNPQLPASLVGGALSVAITGASGAINLTDVGGSAIAIGQAAMAASLPVTIASNQSDVGVNIDKVGGVSVASAQINVNITGLAGSNTQSTGLTTDMFQVGGSNITLGQHLAAASLPVVQNQELSFSLTANVTLTAATGVFLALKAGTSKQTRIQRVQIIAVPPSTPGSVSLQISRATSVSSGTPGTAPTITPSLSSDSVATSVGTTYTVGPTVTGESLLWIAPTLLVPTSATVQSNVLLDVSFDAVNFKPWCLASGTSQWLCLEATGSGTAGLQFIVNMQFTEA